ncbi:protein O-mannosyl-transferase TMTC1 isoform X2 [Periophthalmus magnuspinnatus]|uniref:protein O-mannosyl-transferase TMTC1 isoform X2 n=1 Tax=Periophthalmus magnuspinnatus TaxID=409849 RepID=UPI002436CD19|nr:protein O-mannosyl-transferase TMTC1 isoform X2 [Periophthalmus magnuspinnatus]
MTAPARDRRLLPRLGLRLLPGEEALCSAARCAAVAVLCVLCYGNSLRGELVHDDVWAIVNNPDVRPGAGLGAAFRNDFWGKRMSDNTSHKSYRPLCILSFKLNIWLSGMAPLYFHLVNVALHILVSCLLLVTCRRCVFSDSRSSFLAALLFAVHPVHTEAVSGIVGRADVLAALLFLLSFLCYVRSVDPSLSLSSPPSLCLSSPLSLVLSLLLGTCAMLVKETGVTVFGVCLVYDALILCRKPLLSLLSGSGVRLFLRESSPLLKRATVVTAHVAVILSIRLWLMGGSMPLFSEQDNPASFSPHLLTRFLTYSFLLSFNAWLLLAPVTLCYDWQVGSIPLVESLSDPRNGATVILLLLLCLLCATCASSIRQQSREVLVGLLFLIFPFIPASNLFFRVGFVVAERVLYMPSMGYCILVSHGLTRLCPLLGRWGSAALSVALLLLFSWKTVAQNQVWLSREALFRSGIQTLPQNAKVHYNYANFLKDTGRHPEAIRHYNIALRLYPRHASALNNLGTLTSDTHEAERFYRKALDISPQHNRALFNLGNLLKTRGQDAEAEELLKNSIRFGPHFSDAYSSLASLYAEQKRFSEAKDVYLNGLELCPESSDLHNNYGVFLVDTGEGALAAAHYQKAVKLRPEHYVAMVNLGRLLRSTNDNEQAEVWYKRALSVSRSVDVLSPLGALFYNTGRFEEALQVYREAQLLQASNSDLGLALAQVLAISGRPSEAEQTTRDILLREPGCIECYRLLSALSSKTGDHRQALEFLEVALQHDCDASVRAELLFSRGNQLREMDLLQQAFQSYQQAVQINPDQSQAWMNMGGIKHIKGDYAAARTYYEKALSLSPGSKLLKENLQKLDRLERRSKG